MDYTVRTPMQHQIHKQHQEEELSRKSPRHWVKDDAGQEIGPFIEDADARLTKAALNIFAPGHNWTTFEKEE